MKLRCLAFVVATSFVTSTTFALGGMAGYYQQLQGGGNTNYVTNPTVSSNVNSYVSPTNYYNTRVNTTTGNYVQQGRGSTLGGGGLSAYYQQIGVNSNVESFTYTPPTRTGVGGFSQYWQQNLQANSFDHLCRAVPQPNNATCQGGTFEAIKNNYGCTVDWRCNGGNRCPVVPEPPAHQCNGTWEPQYQHSTQCLTHYFCDRTPDVPDVCPANYDPVCGKMTNGRKQTFSNRCVLERSGAHYVHDGACHQEPPTGHLQITNFAGPQNLQVGQSGTWTVRANAPAGSHLTYSIDWGEQLYASSQRPLPTEKTTFTHQYSRSGTYQVRVTVRNERGQQDSRTLAVQVKDKTTEVVPTIESFNGPSTLKAGQTGTWNVRATHPFDAPVDFSIDWGDYRVYDNGRQSTSPPRWGSQKTFTHAYQNAGTYTVKVTASSKGKSVSRSLVVRVTDTVVSGGAPVIHGVSGPTTLQAGQTGTWSVRASDSSNQSLSYSVDWGEVSAYASSRRPGSFTQTSQFTHSYQNAGTYTVAITAKNQAGKTARTTITVRVQPEYQQPQPQPDYRDHYQFNYVPQFNYQGGGLNTQPVYRNVPNFLDQFYGR